MDQVSEAVAEFIELLKNRYGDFVMNILKFSSVSRMDWFTRSLSFASESGGVEWPPNVRSMQIEFPAEGIALMFIGGDLTLAQEREIIEKRAGVEVQISATGPRAETTLRQALSLGRYSYSTLGSSWEDGSATPASAGPLPQGMVACPSCTRPTPEKIVQRLGHCHHCEDQQKTSERFDAFMSEMFPDKPPIQSASTPLTFRCGCGRRLTAPESMAGKRAKCPHCGAVVRVPGKRESSPEGKVLEESTEQPGRPDVAARPTCTPVRADSDAVAAEETTVTADAVGPTIHRLAERAAREGWNIFASVRVVCASCGAVCRMSTGLGGEYRLVADAGPRKGLIYDVDSPFRCGECEAASVTIVNTRTFLREWLRRLCEELPAAHDDPQIGFQELDGLLEEETGGIIRDHGFRFAGDFEHLWSLAGRCFDQNAEVSSGGGFDTIWSRNDWRKTHWTPFIAHKNERTDTTISVIKDPRGHLWFDVERK